MGKNVVGSIKKVNIKTDKYGDGKVVLVLMIKMIVMSVKLKRMIW